MKLIKIKKSVQYNRFCGQTAAFCQTLKSAEFIHSNTSQIFPNTILSGGSSDYSAIQVNDLYLVGRWRRILSVFFFKQMFQFGEVFHTSHIHPDHGGFRFRHWHAVVSFSN